MKKLLLVMMILGIAGLAGYYYKPAFFKQMNEKLTIKPDVSDGKDGADLVKRVMNPDNIPEKDFEPEKKKKTKQILVSVCPRCDHGYIKCSACNGTGMKKDTTCDICGGPCVLKNKTSVKGMGKEDDDAYWCPKCQTFLPERKMDTCSVCGGSGKKKCSYCKGTGLVAEKEVMKLADYGNKPHGIGKEYTLKGKALAAKPKPGDWVDCKYCKGEGYVVCHNSWHMGKVNSDAQYKPGFSANGGGSGNATPGKGAAMGTSGPTGDSKSSGVSVKYFNDGRPLQEVTLSCPDCKGTGQVKCKDCKGAGIIQIPEEADNTDYTK